jgi:hypothetical protein
VAQATEHARPVVRAAARFQRHASSLPLREVLGELGATELLATDLAAVQIDPMRRYVFRHDLIPRQGLDPGREAGNRAFGHRPAHLEMELAVRVFGDVAVHRLDLGFEFGAVDMCRYGGFLQGVEIRGDHGLRDAHHGTSGATVRRSGTV